MGKRQGLAASAAPRQRAGERLIIDLSGSSYALESFYRQLRASRCPSGFWGISNPLLALLEEGTISGRYVGGSLFRPSATRALVGVRSLVPPTSSADSSRPPSRSSTPTEVCVARMDDRRRARASSTLGTMPMSASTPQCVLLWLHDHHVTCKHLATSSAMMLL